MASFAERVETRKSELSAYRNRQKEIGDLREAVIAAAREGDAEAIKKALSTKGAYHIKVNHVLYKKVTEDDQIISREALKDVTPDLDDGDEQGRKRFMDTLLESVLAEEFANSLNIQSLLLNPSAVSKSMIDADLASVSQTLLKGQEGTSGAGMTTGALLPEDIALLQVVASQPPSVPWHAAQRTSKIGSTSTV